MTEVPERIGPDRILARLGAGGMPEVFLPELGALAPRNRARVRARARSDGAVRRDILRLVPILTAEERLGTVLGGRYALDAILGEGGTSVVYSATQTFTKRPVALKILKPEHARNRELVSRFLKEARVASTLTHTNVVAVLDMGTTEGDTYLAMERLSGESLGALLGREGTLTVERTLSLLRPLMEAVALAHERGVVHRDLKPENVLVGDRGDGHTRAILLDFGMAKTAEVAWGHMTQSGILVGTPFYMSPEQTEGASDIDAATDVWAMGVTLYRCLSGELPFFATAPSALLLAIARGEHVALGTRAPSLPAPIAAWVEGALVSDRAHRYPHMRAMLAALDRALEGQLPVTHAQASSSDAANERPPARRIWPRYVAAGVALVAILAALSWTLAPPPPAPRAEARVASPAPVPPPASRAEVPAIGAPRTEAAVAPAPPPSEATEAPRRVPGRHARSDTPGSPHSAGSPPPTRSSSGLASEW